MNYTLVFRSGTNPHSTLPLVRCCHLQVVNKAYLSVGLFYPLNKAKKEGSNPPGPLYSCRKENVVCRMLKGIFLGEIHLLSVSAPSYP